MQQFNALLDKHADKVQIISISINSLNIWNSLFVSENNRFAMLKTGHPNWKHYVLKSTEDPRLRNDIPGDNLQYILSQFKTNQFPLYIVLNDEGKVIATPLSAIQYLKDNL